MANPIQIKLKRVVDNSYPILIGRDLFRSIAADLAKKPLGRNYAVITDSNVISLHGEKLLSELCLQGIDACALYFTAGESSKTPGVWLSLTAEMLRLGYARDSAIIALGGGVAGDLAGFVASSYMRGIPWIQIPTTLLAMADASIGGKVGIDLPAGKNLLGAFWQPKAVYADLACLKTLPHAHMLNGLAEVAKSALIKDTRLFSLLEKNGKSILKADNRVLVEAMKASLRVKGAVVEKDEFETLGLRKILNYGHTIGHALEALSGFQLLHGIAVALGMKAAARIAVEMNIMKYSEEVRQANLLSRLGFPGRVQAYLAKKINTPAGREKLFNYIFKDKKAQAGIVEMVLLSGIGRTESNGGRWTVPVDRLMIGQGLGAIVE